MAKLEVPLALGLMGKCGILERHEINTTASNGDDLRKDEYGEEGQKTAMKHYCVWEVMDVEMESACSLWGFEQEAPFSARNAGIPRR